MADVTSKNIYELLGNTSDQDSDREPDVLPTKSVDKPVGRSGKRDAPKAAPAEPARPDGRPGPRRGGFSGSEATFRDRTNLRDNNREKPTGGEDGVRTGRDSGPGTRARGRGQRGPRRGGDRHSRTGQTEHVKQTDQAWGAQTGDGELADETAGDAIAAKEAKDGWGETSAEAAAVPDGAWSAGDENPEWKTDAAAPAGDGFGDSSAPAADAEPEDTNKSYADYLAEQAAKKMKGLGLMEARAPNEGAKEDKKWKGAKELSKEDQEAAYFQGKEEKARRERERTNKKVALEDFTYTVANSEESGGRGGRGRGRGRGERGEFRGRGERGEYRGRGRGDREEGGYRGRGDREEGGYRGRGEYRGRGDRGEYRGRGRARGGREGGPGQTAAVAVDDESAFPSLGGSK